jgi:MFS family permease
MNTSPGSTAAPANGVDSSYSWLRLAVSVLFATIGGAGMWTVVVVLPAVQAEFGVDRADASLPYTATMIGFALGNVVVGRAVDRHGYVLPALLSILLMATGFFVAAASPSILVFAIVQGVIGLGAAVTFGPLIADLSHWFLRRRGVAVVAAASGNYLAGSLWPLAMQGFVLDPGWRTTYVAVGAICVVTMLPLLLVLRPRLPISAHPSGSAGMAAFRPRPIAMSPATLQALLIVAGLACCVAMSMPQVHIVAYCMDLGYGVARGTEMLSIMLVGGIVSRVASGFVADRIGGVRTLLIGSVLQGLSLLLYIPYDGLVSLYVVSLVFGLSQGGIVPCYAIVVREYMPAAEAGQRVGLVIMATIMGMALGGWMSGLIYDLTGSYAAAFINGVAWNLLNVTVMLLVLWRTRPRPDAPAAA